MPVGTGLYHQWPEPRDGSIVMTIARGRQGRSPERSSELTENTFFRFILSGPRKKKKLLRGLESFTKPTKKAGERNFNKICTKFVVCIKLSLPISVKISWGFGIHFAVRTSICMKVKNG